MTESYGATVAACLPVPAPAPSPSSTQQAGEVSQ